MAGDGWLAAIVGELAETGRLAAAEVGPTAGD
jgi:hypothetical protein